MSLPIHTCLYAYLYTHTNTWNGHMAHQNMKAQVIMTGAYMFSHRQLEAAAEEVADLHEDLLQVPVGCSITCPILATCSLLATSTVPPPCIVFLGVLE